MKRTIAILLLTVMVLTFVACSAKSKLIGTWENPYQTITFLKDGTGLYTTLYGVTSFMTYSVNGDKLTMTIEGITVSGTVKISGKTMTLDTGSRTMVFTKQ